MIPSSNTKLPYSWEYYFKRLKQFHAEYGHCNVPFQWEQDTALAYWTEIQRRSKINLSKVHYRQLNELNFDWKFEDLSWEAMFQRMVQFQKTHKHLRIDPKDTENGRLREWLMQQKWKYHSLKKNKKELLQPYSYLFIGKSEKDLVWNERLEQLKEFVAEFGHAKVPQGWKRNKSLATWVITNRKRLDRMSKDQVNELNKLGFIWGRLEPTWEEIYQRLIAFKKEFGHCSPGQKNHDQLALWAIGQRVLNNKNKLQPYRKDLLNAIHFDWNPMESRWLKQFNNYKSLYVKYKKKIPYKVVKDNEFDNWLYTQKVYIERNKLSEKQIKMLQSVGVDLIRRPITEWDDMLKELMAFHAKYGHFKVFKPELKKLNLKLAAWVDMQRKKYKNGTLIPERIAKLNAVEFPWSGMNKKATQP